MIRLTMKILSILALIFLILPVITFLAGKISLEKMQFYMAISTIVWFITASMWMWKENKS